MQVRSLSHKSRELFKSQINFNLEFFCNFVIFLKKNEFFIDNGKLLSNKVCGCTFLSFVWTKISIGYTRGKTFFKNLHVKKHAYKNIFPP